jgi:hypothetical protein
VKVSYDDQNARFRVPDMNQFREQELRQAFADRKIIIQDVQKMSEPIGEGSY